MFTISNIKNHIKEKIKPQKKFFLKNIPFTIHPPPQKKNCGEMCKMFPPPAPSIKFTNQTEQPNKKMVGNQCISSK